MKKLKLSSDQVLGIILLIVSAAFGWQATLTRPSRIRGDVGPAVFPLILCAVLGLCAIALLFRKPDDKTPKKAFMTKEEWKRLIILYGIYVLFYVLLWIFGYYVAIPVVLFIISYLFGRPKNVPIWKTAVYTAAVSLAIHVIYKVLMDSTMPTGILF